MDCTKSHLLAFTAIMKVTHLLVIVLMTVALASCGGSQAQQEQAQQEAEPGPQLAVAVSPSSALMDQGATQQFTATVTGTTNTAVTWSVQETNGGSVTAAGLYTAPNTGGTFHVVATSQADPSKSAIAAVTVSSGSFVATGNVLTIRLGATAARLADGRVLIVGGVDSSQPDGPILATAELYLPGSGTFQFTGSLITARSGHTATLLSSGKVLIAGGGNGAFASAELYDPATESFSPTGDMTVARGDHTATLLADGRVLIIGDGSAELYNPATGVFVPTGSVDHAFGHTATLLPNGKVLIAGGITSSDFALGTAELYDPASGTFSATSLMTANRFRHTATLLNDGRVLIVGGDSPNFQLASAEVYNPASGTFTSTGSMALRRMVFTANLLASGRVLVAGGLLPGECALPDECGLPTNTAELYDPVAGTFAPAASMTQSRSGHTATLLTNGEVLVVGGRNDSSAELFRE